MPREGSFQTKLEVEAKDNRIADPRSLLWRAKKDQTDSIIFKTPEHIDYYSSNLGEIDIDEFVKLDQLSSLPDGYF